MEPNFPECSAAQLTLRQLAQLQCRVRDVFSYRPGHASELALAAPGMLVLKEPLLLFVSVWDGRAAL